MSQSSAVIDALKRQLRQRGLTYADVGARLGLSESSMKRVFAQKTMDLDRLERICEMLGIDFAELFELAGESGGRLTELGVEEERELVADPRLLLVAVLAISHWSAGRILATYRIEEPELVGMLARLDRMRILDLLPGNRIRVRLARNFNWRRGGPIQRFFEERLQQEFFQSSFSGRDELRLMVNGALSAPSIARLQEQMQRIGAEFDSLVDEDRHLDEEGRKGVSMVLAIRPWEPELFAVLRRVQG